MRIFLSTVAAFSLLIPEVCCLVCEQCIKMGNYTCTGTAKPCLPGVTHCETGLMNNTVGNGTILIAFKGCVHRSNQDFCGTTIIFRNSKISMWTYRECCRSDSCNTKTFVVPDTDQTPNGYSCPDCFTSQSGYCTPTGSIHCFGNELSCTNFTGMLARPGENTRTFSMSGCAIKNACKVGNSLLAGSNVHSYKMKCSYFTKP